MGSPLPVRQDAVALRWHEAVAVVRAVADALEDGRLRSVPSSGELALETDGSLYLNTRAATITSAPAQAATQLRELLGDLLSSDAPTQLRAVAEQPFPTISDFRQALAFFERPTLVNDRRVLAERLHAVQQERHLEEEVERLRRKTLAHEEDKPPAEKPSNARRRRSLRKPALAAAIVLGVGAGGAVAMFNKPAVAGRETAQRAEDKSGTADKGFIQKLRAAAEAAFGSPEAPATKVASTEKPSPAPARPAPRRRTPGTSPATQPSTSATASAPAALANLKLAPPTRALPWTPPDIMLPVDLKAVFTRHDSDVVPPVLLRPHLPRVESIGLPPDQLGTVEMVVGEDGRVDEVRLVRTTVERRYYDAMILAAVKAWVFRPASRSGHPVRYRLAIRLT